MISFSFSKTIPALFALCLSCASAATVAEFNFNSSGLSSSDTEINTTTSDISSGAGITGGTDLSTDQGAGGTPGIRIKYSDLYPQGSGNKTLADAINDDLYYSFTITPLAGQAINFETFTAYIDKNGGGAFFGYYLMSSVDGFTTVDTIDSFDGHGTNITNLNFDVSALSGITTATEFRLYIRTDNFTNGNNDFDLDNVIMTATVIPEPSSALLAGFSALVLLRRRR